MREEAVAFLNLTAFFETSLILQRIILHIVASVRIYFGTFWEMAAFSVVQMAFNDIR